MLTAPGGSGSGATGDVPDEVKDIRSGEQHPADAATWQPPTEDLYPRVLSQSDEKGTLS